MNVTLKQLQALILVARYASFTKAAEAMHLTQSSVSLLVRDLEEALSAKLLDRSTRSVALTEVGQDLIAGAERILGDLNHVVTNVGELVARRRGRVVLTAPLVLSSTFVPSVIATFRSRYPGIELLLKDSLPDQVLPQVANSAADVGIGTFGLTPDGVHASVLFREPLAAVFPIDHALAGKPQLNWSDLRDMPLLALPRGSVLRELADSGLIAAGLEGEPVFEATYVGTLIGLVKAGLGVAIVPGSATVLADQSKIAWKRLDNPVIEREVFLIHRGAGSLSPAAEALIETIEQEALTFSSAVTA